MLFILVGNDLVSNSGLYTSDRPTYIIIKYYINNL